MSRGSILIVDDEPRWVESSRLALERHGYLVEWVQSMDKASRLAQQDNFSLIIVNSALAFVQEGRFLKKMIRCHPQRVVVISDAESIPMAIRVLKLGTEYENRPFEDRNLIKMIDKSIKQSKVGAVPAT